MNHKKERTQKRHKRIRGKISGTAERPRLCISRSAKYIYAQIIDDEKRITIVSANDKEIKKGKKTERAVEVGKLIAKEAKNKKIKKVVFDRGGYKYHGRVKSLAEGARKEGLEF